MFRPSWDKKKLGLCKQDFSQTVDSESEPDHDDTLSDNFSNDSSDDPTNIFYYSLNNDEFLSITRNVKVRRSSKNDPGKTRQNRRFIPGVWQHKMQSEISKATGASCGFFFDDHYLNFQENRGKFNGT